MTMPLRSAGAPSGRNPLFRLGQALPRRCGAAGVEAILKLSLVLATGLAVLLSSWLLTLETLA